MFENHIVEILVVASILVEVYGEVVKNLPMRIVGIFLFALAIGVEYV